MFKYNSLTIFQRIRGINYNKVKNWYGNLIKPKPLKPPYKHVVQIGDPTLRVKSDPVLKNNIKSDEIQFILQRMKFVYKKYDCVGLSAPQIGIPLRIILIGLTKHQLKDFTDVEIGIKQMQELPLTVLINPVVTVTSFNKVTFAESCESIKGFWADVPRHYSLDVDGYDENGKNITLSTKGWTSRIIQHEMDHLNGKLYTDIMDKKSLTCGCWENVNEANGKVSLPYGPG